MLNHPLIDPLKPALRPFIRPVRQSLNWVLRARLVNRCYAASPFAIRLQRSLPAHPKIGMAVLAHERPDYLALCLDSLFQTNLHDYDITFLIQDDGSTDPRVREIINRPRDPRYKIIRWFTPKGHNSWGAAFNKAIRRLMQVDQFDILGSCDSDALFHPDWLDHMMKVCLWAKQHHHDHILGPFSVFNSSNQDFHCVLGQYLSPYGDYVVKERMGALTYFYLRQDLEQLGLFREHRDDETFMTHKFKRRFVRNFCTHTSFVHHLGEQSVLNQWRPKAVTQPDLALNPAPYGWPEWFRDRGSVNK